MQCLLTALAAVIVLLSPWVGAEILTEEVFRAATRYSDRLLASEPGDTLYVFPGRSLTLVSLIAKKQGAQVLNVPASGLTELNKPGVWTDPKTAAPLALYKELVSAEISRAVAQSGAKRVVVVDAVNSGGSLLFFQDLVKDITKDRPLTRELPVSAKFVRIWGARDEDLASLRAAGIPEVTLELPTDTSGLKLTPDQVQQSVDRFYYHDYETERLSADMASVPQFDPLQVDVADPQSVQQYKRRFADRSNPLYASLEAQVAKRIQNTPVSGLTRPFSSPVCFQFERLAA